jgi:hypothetical protein
VRRGAHAECPGPVVAPDAVMRVCAEASPDQRDRRSCLCSLRRTGPWRRSSGGCWVCSELRLWRDSALVTTAQDRRLASIFSPSWLVWWCVVVGVFVLFRACLCGGVNFDSLCTIASFLNDRAVLLLPFKKIF